jgi:hypothetical protein
MKQETVERLKLSLAGVLRANIATPWAWDILECLLPDWARKNRRRVQRAALKSKGDPLGFVSRYLAGLFSTPDPKCPERAAIKLCSVLDRLADVTEHRDRLGELSDRDMARDFSAFFGVLAAQPGRKRLDIYDKASRLVSEKTVQRICYEVDSDYREKLPTMTKAERRKRENRMRSGLYRRRQELTKAQGVHETPS